MVSSLDPHNMFAKVESITAKTGCTSCTNWTISFKVRGFETKSHLFQRHFIFLNLFQLKTFLHPKRNIQSHILKFQPFLTSFAIFMHLMIYFELNDPVIGKHYNSTQKRFKLGMVSSFEPHSMCAKVERILAKTGCTSCANWTIPFKVRGFQTKTHLFQRHFIFINLFQLKTFSAFKMHNSKPHTKISTLCDFICYVSCI